MKTAIITGGNSGIGFATARKLREQGCRVIITGRDEEKLATAANEINCEYHLADMADLEALALLCEKFNDDGLDYLVLNAAAAMFKPISETTVSEFDSFVNMNIKGSYFLIKWLANALIKNKGAISIVTSAVVDNGLPNASIYALTKGAMDSLAKSLAAEFSDNGIRVNVVAPGAVDTPILAKLGIPAEHVKALREQQEAMIPLKRYGNPDEIAHVIVSQLSSTYVTGSTWSVDGGVNAI